MGRELYAEFPVFADAFDAVTTELDRHLLRPIRDVMWGSNAAVLDSTEFAQPALFVVEVALFRLLESWGLTPDYLVGHSIGELTAAHVSGVLSLENAAALVAARGRLMQRQPEGGAMVAVSSSEAEIRGLLRDGVGRRVDLAAVNGPDSVVVSGPEDAVLAIAEEARALGRRVHRLAVSHAFHSSLMEPMLDEFNTVASGMSLSPCSIPVVSNVTGELASDDFGSAPYWVRHVREAVRFADGVGVLAAAGVTRFLELGPASGLTAAIEQSVTPAEPVTASTIRKDRSEPVDPADGAGRVERHGAGRELARGLPRRAAAGPADVCLPAAALLVVGPHVGVDGRRGTRVGQHRSRSCSARSSSRRRPAVWCSPAGCRCHRIRGWPITPWVASCCSPAPASSNSPSGRATKWAAEPSTS